MIRQTIEETCSLHARIGWQGLTKAEYMDEGDYYLVTGVDFSDGLIDFENCHYVSKDRYEQDKYIQLTNNDVLVTKDGTIGKVAIIRDLDKPATLNSGVFVVRPKDKEKLLSEYLVFALKSGHFSRFIEQIKVGCTIAHLNQAKFLKYDIPNVPISEQLHVVEVLNKVENVIKTRQQQLQQLDELVKARFVELFGDYNLSHTQDNWKPIFKIGKVVGGATPKTNIDEFWNGEFRWITPAELQADTGYIYDSARKLTKAGIESCSLQEMPIDTVILSSRAPIGKVAIAGNTFYCNQGFKNIICSKEVLPRYLYTVLLLNTDYLNSLGRGATFKEISKSIVENIKIPVPQLELQNEFTTFVKQIDKSKFGCLKIIILIKTILKTIISR